MDKKLTGVIAPITTPFDSNENLSLEALKENMDFYAQSRINGYLALGSNGENKSLNNSEKEKTLETIVKGKGKTQSVMAGCIFESTKETIEFGKKASDMGADFLTLLSPSYFKKYMTDDVLFKYFTDVADASGIPCLLYNAPQFCGGITLSPELLERCSQHHNIVGMKDSSKGNIEIYCNILSDKMHVMAGSANFFIDCLRMGGTAGVVSLANIFPDLVCDLYDMYMNDDPNTDITNKRVLAINKGVSGAGGVSAVKYAMDLAGLNGGKPRLPLLPLKNDVKNSIEKLLKDECLI